MVSAMQFTVTPEELDKFANYCDAQVEDIQSLVISLQGYIQDLEALYHGPAAQRLQGDIVTLGTDSGKLQVAMSDITRTLRQNALTYANGETRNVTNLQAAVSALHAANSY
jgi:WXG100 family type VII secretion target